MSKSTKIIAFTWAVITVIAIIISSYALVNTQVSLKYMFEDAANLGYDHPANVQWIFAVIQLLKIFIGYLVLNLGAIIWFIFKFRKQDNGHITSVSSGLGRSASL